MSGWFSSAWPPTPSSRNGISSALFSFAISLKVCAKFAAYAVPKLGGICIPAITIVNPGSGYTSTPTVIISPATVGSGATAAGVLGTGIIYTAGVVRHVKSGDAQPPACPRHRHQ